MSFNLKETLGMIWRLTKVLFCIVIWLIWMMSLISAFVLIGMIIWAIGGNRTYYYVRYGRDITQEESREWNDWTNANFEKVLLFPFPQIMGKDLKK